MNWIECATWNAAQSGATAITGGGGAVGGIGGALAAVFVGMITLPFKLLGINSPQDLLYRMLFIMLGFMLLGFALLIIVHEAANSEAGQQAEQSAAMAAA